MSEVSMRHTMKNHFSLIRGLHWQRIEDSLSVGIPDINICYERQEYWIEAKQMDEHKLPKRIRTTPVRIGLSAEQALWLRQRSEAGGRALVVAKLGREWFIWDDYFERLRDGELLQDLRDMAIHNWTGAFDVRRVVGFQVE